jgi:hypothetical protein
MLWFCAAKRGYETTMQVGAVKWRNIQIAQTKIEVFAVAKIRNTYTNYEHCMAGNNFTIFLKQFY